jgi:RNA polymerase sigma factor (sigma-70 family)
MVKMRNDEQMGPLLERAARGEESAWREIVSRFSALVSSTCYRHGLSGSDADDVIGNVWLQLVARLPTLRVSEALPGWLATIAKRECLALLRNKQRQIPSDQDFTRPVESDLDRGLLADERRDAARRAVGQLPARDRALISMLFSDPPTPYADISSSLGIPVGAIGPTRQRCLARARRTPAVAALLAGSTQEPGVTRRSAVTSHDSQRSGSRR